MQGSITDDFPGSSLDFAAQVFTHADRVIKRIGYCVGQHGELMDEFKLVAFKVRKSYFPTDCILLEAPKKFVQYAIKQKEARNNLIEDKYL